MQNYNVYQFTLKEKIQYTLQGSLIACMIGILFYQSIIGILIVCPIIFFYLKRKRKRCLAERKWQLNQEFRDGIISLSAALSAGYSIENAFEEALKDLSLLYPDKAMIIIEFSCLLNQIRMNVTVERVLSEFGNRTGIEDIISFAEVFTTAKRTGGDMIKIIKTTCNTIGDKIEIQREIKTLITAKKFEASIMNLIPFVFISYLSYFSPGFLGPLYHNMFGIIVMTIMLLCYLGAFQLSEKIMMIEM